MKFAALICGVVLGVLGNARATDLKKYNPLLSSGFDIYGSSPVSTGTVIPSSLQAIDSPASGEVPSKSSTGNTFEWIPMSAGVGDAVLAGTQTFSGANTFGSTVTLTAVPSTQTYFPAGRVYSVIASSGNTVSFNTPLYTYTIPANMLQTAGSTLDVVFFGTTTAASTSRTWTLTVGGTVCTTNTVTLNGQSWELRCVIQVTGTNTQRLYGIAHFDASSGSTIVDEQYYIPATLTASNANDVTVSVFNTTASGNTFLNGGYGIWSP